MESLFDEICELSVIRYEENRIIEEERIREIQRRLGEERRRRLLEYWYGSAVPGG